MTGGRFVVQHHLATADHYDLRLEIDGVLVSWAVPKGPSTDPSVRRLAVRTDDHALGHETIEGAFGRTVVQVWDRGTYRNRSHHGPMPLSPATALERGHLSVWLDGTKLQGGYTMIRTERTGRDTWLLIKKADEEAAPGYDIVRAEPRSVLSGLTVEEIRAEG